jgi:rod shape-determining protein MreC
LLLTDQNSVISVKTISDGSYALVKGAEDGIHLVSSFTKEDNLPKLGDLLITSGSAQIFPPDILVGKITKIDNNRFYVLPFVDFNNLDYVQIVKSE